MSSAEYLVIAFLYASLAFASFVAMNADPIYPKSAPDAWAARTAWPVAIEPDKAKGPSNHSLISWINANGEVVPACPPAPAATAINPSAPFSIALCAKRLLITSCKTIPP